MRRVLPLLASLLLAACASSPSYRYYGQRDVVWETPTASTAGGTYASAASVPGWPDWYDHPTYYSIFWSFHRGFIDPLWYPDFYYGVTWFPRDYFAVSFGRWHGPGWYLPGWYPYLAYSPYRWAWIDHYYAWYPWYLGYPHYRRYYPPRYGNVRNETERLSRYSAAFRGADPWLAPSPYRDYQRAARNQAAVEARRQALRGASYGPDGGRGRIDPGTVARSRAAAGALPTRAQQNAPGPRIDPGVSGFRAPAAGEGRQALPPRSAPVSARQWVDQGVPYPARRPVEPARRAVYADPEPSAPSRSRIVSVPAPRPAPATREWPPGAAAVDEGGRRGEVYRPSPSPRFEAPRAEPYRQAASMPRPSEPPARIWAPREASPAPRPETPAAAWSRPRAEPAERPGRAALPEPRERPRREPVPDFEPPR